MGNTLALVNDSITKGVQRDVAEMQSHLDRMNCAQPVDVFDSNTPRPRRGDSCVDARLCWHPETSPASIAPVSAPPTPEGEQLDDRFAEAIAAFQNPDSPPFEDGDEEEVWATPEEGNNGMLRPQLAASTPVNGQILELELRTLLQEKKTAVAAALAAARENALLKERVAFLEAARQAEIADEGGYTPASSAGGRTPLAGQHLSFATPDAAAAQRGCPPGRSRGGETPAGGMKSPTPGASGGGGKLARSSSLRKPLTPLGNIAEQHA